MKSLYQSSTIPFEVERAFRSRGFIETTFFVMGEGTIGAGGQYYQTIPGGNKNSIALVTTYPGSSSAVLAQMVPGYASNNYGASSTQFDVTNPAGTTFRYTYDGTGTDPNINAVTLPIGSRVVVFGNFNPANQNAAIRPFFTVTGSGNNYFEVNNPTPGVVESNKTLGAGGSITGGPLGQNYALFVEGTALDEFAFIVFLFDKDWFIRN